MKPKSGKFILIAASVAALAALPLQGAWAQSHGGGHGGGGAGMHGGSGGSHGGWSGGSNSGGWHGGSNSGGWHGGSNSGGWHGGGGNWHGGGNNWHGGGGWHGGGWHGGSWHGGYWGPSWNFYLGAPWYPWAWGYPYYPYYPYYGGSTVVYDDPAPAYWGPATTTVIPAPAMDAAPAAARRATQFRYYCPDPGGYYPDVRTCSKGWVQQPQS